MPWTVLGRKWHLLRKGFPPGKRISWEAEVLEELLEMLSAAAPKAQTLWNHSQVISLILPEQREPWAQNLDEAAVAARVIAGRSERTICDGARGRFWRRAGV